MPKILLLFVSLLFFFSACQSNQKPQALVKGYPLPDLELPNLMGKQVKLSDVENKLVLIEFWASWCKPCLDRHAELKNIFETYHNANFQNANGFDIFYINLDQKKEDWERIIQKDQIQDWTHLADLKGMRQSEIPKRFQFEQIPTSYLIDARGIIIGKDMSPHQLFYELKYRL